MKRCFAIGAILTALFVVATAAPASAAAGALKPSRHHVNCGAVGVSGGTKNCALITFTNTSAAPVTVTNVAIEGDADFSFVDSNNPCVFGLQVPAGGSCGVTVFFDPSQTGHRSATLFVFDTAGNQAQPGANRVGIGGRGTA
jgi:hypothetical protein